MLSCYNLYSCDPGSYPDILYVSDSILADYIGQRIYFNGDDTKVYTVGTTKQYYSKTLENPGLLESEGEYPVQWEITSLIYNGTEYITGPAPSYNLSLSNVEYLNCTETACTVSGTPTDNYSNQATFFNDVFTSLNLPLLAYPADLPLGIVEADKPAVVIGLPEDGYFTITVDRILGPISPSTYTLSLDATNDHDFIFSGGSTDSYSGFATDLCLENELGITEVELAVCDCGCLDGEVYDAARDRCIKTETVDPVENKQVYTVAYAGNVTSYGNQGGAFYEDTVGRPWPLTATGTQILDDNGDPLNALATIVDPLWGDAGSVNGRLNQIGVWATGGTAPLNEWIGFTNCVNVPETKTYNIGIAADNRLRIKIDGQLFVWFDTPNTFNFRKWHVIPIQLTAGQHIIELEGYNDSQFAAFGAEIYDADRATLQAMTTVAELEAVTIFTTNDTVGQTFDLGETSGYTCPEGYALSTCDGLTCIRITENLYEPCSCYRITNCDDPEDVRLITTAAPLDVNSIYTFTFDNTLCFTVEFLEDCETTHPEETVDSTFVSCEECLPAPPVQPELGVACEIKPRLGEPGFSSKHCDPKKLIDIKCKFANSVFAQFKRMRYGIETCCEYDLDKIDIKNQMVDLGFLYDPDLCVDEEISTDCCNQPCDAEANIFVPVYPPAP